MRYFQENRSKTKRVRLLLTGLEYFVQQLRETIRETTFLTDRWEVFSPRLNQKIPLFLRLINLSKFLFQVDLWYQIGGYVGRGRIYKLTKMLNVPVVLHWVGSDVLAAQKYFSNKSFTYFTKEKLIHWAGAPWLVNELEQIGINARFVPLPLKTVGTFLSQEPPPLPKDFRIVTYLSEQRPEFYGWTYILQLAKDFPHIEIIVIGATGTFACNYPLNIRFLGWVDNLFPVLASCTVMVRMTEHDGYGGTIQEALSLGRYAIWSYPFPGAFLAKDYSTLRYYVEYLYELHKKRCLSVNKIGREYMLENMHPKYLALQIIQGLQDILNKADISHG